MFARAVCVWAVLSLAPSIVLSAEVSAETQGCLVCHETLHPGLVADWRASRHARTSVADSLALPADERRVSVTEAPAGLSNVAVGCAECHGLRGDTHPDTHDHQGTAVHVVVTPDDCATCHPVEADQFSRNLMSQAHGNLMGNALYRDLADVCIGTQTFSDDAVTYAPADATTLSDACLQCHGTRVEYLGLVERDTPFGPMRLPQLAGWPNQGVGRVNPDGSKGACTACHTRHAFQIEMARRPETCAQCHKGPDVPAYAVYQVSKHGNLYGAVGDSFDYEPVPWVVGRDVRAPTCATCHASKLASADGTIIAERTHEMGDRNSWRLMGLPYGHPHPVSADTSGFRNSMGLPLPTELTGESVASAVIGPEEQGRRRTKMGAVCQACHSGSFVDGHFKRLDHSIQTTNAMTLAATRVLLSAWDHGFAKGPADGDSVFNEAIEQDWVRQWLFYANSTRYASAMVGADYGVFANGRFYMSSNLQDMVDWLKTQMGIARQE